MQILRRRKEEKKFKHYRYLLSMTTQKNRINWRILRNRGLIALRQKFLFTSFEGVLWPSTRGGRKLYLFFLFFSSMKRNYRKTTGRS